MEISIGLALLIVIAVFAGFGAGMTTKEQEFKKGGTTARKPPVYVRKR